MTPAAKIGLGTAGVLLVLLLLSGESKAKTPPLPPMPPLPTPPPPMPPMPPLPKPPTLIGDKRAVTTGESLLFTEPGGDVPVRQRPLVSNVPVRVLAIGFTFPGKGEWSKVLVQAGTAGVLFDVEEDTVGFVPSDILGDPRAWVPDFPGGTH